MSDRTAVIGAGLIGRAWAIVFARAGHRVALYDVDPAALQPAFETIGANLAHLAACGLVADPGAVLARIDGIEDLGEALAGAGYVQENGPENLEVKRALFRELDRRAEPEAVIASS